MLSLAEITSDYRAKLIIPVYKKWIVPGEKVLDIGCGNGVVSEKLIKGLKISLTGCDITNYLIHDIPYVKMNRSDKLPFNNLSFDTAMFNDVLHHTDKKNQLKLLEESLRVAKKVIIFEVQPSFYGKIFDFVLNKIHNLGMNIPFTFKTIDEWKTLFKNHNYKFKVKNIQSPYFYPFKHVAFLLKI